MYGDIEVLAHLLPHNPHLASSPSRRRLPMAGWCDVPLPTLSSLAKATEGNTCTTSGVSNSRLYILLAFIHWPASGKPVSSCDQIVTDDLNDEIRITERQGICFLRQIMRNGRRNLIHEMLGKECHITFTWWHCSIPLRVISCAQGHQPGRANTTRLKNIEIHVWEGPPSSQAQSVSESVTLEPTN